MIVCINIYLILTKAYNEQRYENSQPSVVMLVVVVVGEGNGRENGEDCLISATTTNVMKMAYLPPPLCPPNAAGPGLISN